MSSNGQPWIDLDEGLVERGPEPRDGGKLVTLGRRSFLQALGLSGVVSAAGCERLPVQHALPLLETHEDSQPGLAVRYASTCLGCTASCGLLVTVRDGRPVKMEGNPVHALSKGGLCALGQGTVRGVYDAGRLRKPRIGGQDSTWEAVDKQVMAGLAAAKGKVVVLSPTLVSPTARKTVQAMLAKVDGRLVEYDPQVHSGSADADAYRLLDGTAKQPSLQIDQADILVTIGGDLLGAGGETVTHTSQYAGRRGDRKKQGEVRHYHVGGGLTLTGAASDIRVQATAAERTLIAAHLLGKVAASSSHPQAGLALELTQKLPKLSSAHASKVGDMAKELAHSRGRGLVVSGSRQTTEHLAVALINRLIGAEGSTLSLLKASNTHRGSDAEMAQLVVDLGTGKVGALIVLGGNPVEQLPAGDKLAALIKKLPLSVAVTDRPTATADACKIVATAHHFLECWGDAAPRSDVLTLAQPTLRPLFDTRDPMDSVLRWSGEKKPYLTVLMETWQAEVPAPGGAKWSELTAGSIRFKAFWNKVLAEGVVPADQARLAFAPAVAAEPPGVKPAVAAVVAGADGEPAVAVPEPAPEPTMDRAALGKLFAAVAAPKAGTLEVELVEEVGPRDGRGSFNPWLRELPDPLTRGSWAAMARIAPALAKKQSIADGDVVSVTVGAAKVEMQARIVPGQHPDVVGVPVGYGVKDGDGGESARNGYRLAKLDKAGLQTAGMAASLARVGKGKPLPLMQWHSSSEGRPIIHQVTSADGKVETAHHGTPSMWGDDHKYSPHWQMVIDLDACTGCGACVVACQAENNIPVVGPERIADHRDMYWLRIDRYFEGDENDPEVLFEPMLCAQCDNAPCETVCPATATVHSHDGLNMQAYNRCVGTRYCANNCPYKVRRFNWFDFTPKDPLERMVLNPDVVVRDRGTMEKCTFCVQRIQTGRIDAKKKDGTTVEPVQTACQQSCPAKAIHFGDRLNDHDLVAKIHEPRAFQVLADLGVKPSIHYLARVRRRGASEAKGQASHGEKS